MRLAMAMSAAESFVSRVEIRSTIADSLASLPFACSSSTTTFCSNSSSLDWIVSRSAFVAFVTSKSCPTRLMIAATTSLLSRLCTESDVLRAARDVLNVASCLLCSALTRCSSWLSSDWNCASI